MLNLAIHSHRASCCAPWSFFDCKSISWWLIAIQIRLICVVIYLWFIDLHSFRGFCLNYILFKWAEPHSNPHGDCVWTSWRSCFDGTGWIKIAFILLISAEWCGSNRWNVYLIRLPGTIKMSKNPCPCLCHFSLQILWNSRTRNRFKMLITRNREKKKTPSEAYKPSFTLTDTKCDFSSTKWQYIKSIFFSFWV